MGPGVKRPYGLKASLGHSEDAVVAGNASGMQTMTQRPGSKIAATGSRLPSAKELLKRFG